MDRPSASILATSAAGTSEASDEEKASEPNGYTFCPQGTIRYAMQALLHSKRSRMFPMRFRLTIREGLPLCTHGHIIREKKEVRGRCTCDALLCQECPNLVCQRCGQILCRDCGAFVDGDLVNVQAT